MTNWKEKLKNQFKQTVPADYELEFDICMKCGRRLQDKKYSTLKEHQEQNHKIPRKKKLREILFKYPVFTIVLTVSLVAIGLTIADSTIDAFLNPLLRIAYPELINIEKCQEDILTLKQQLYRDGSFNNNHVEEFNRLLNECNLNFYGVVRDPPIFEQSELEMIK